MPRFEIVIENQRPLSFLELKEILEIVDGHVLDIASPYGGEFAFLDHIPRRWRTFAPGLSHYPGLGEISFIEIESVRPGSIILTVIGGAAAFGLGAIAVGVRRSQLGSELARFGENVGEILAEGVAKINESLEDWSDRNLKLRDRKTRVSFRRAAGEPEPGTKPRRR